MASSPESPQLPSSHRPSVGGEIVLAFSIHGDDCSVAIGWPEETAATAAEFWSRQPERQRAGGPPPVQAQGPLASRDALVLLDRLLARTAIPLHRVRRLAFAQGPGAFTSLRVAAGVVQGLGLALGRPVAGICSFAAMAAHAPGWHQAGADWLQLGAIDARMGECYYAVHRCRAGSYPQAVVGPLVGTATQAITVFERLLGQHASIVAAGNAFAAVPALADWAGAAKLDPVGAGKRAPTADAVLVVAISSGAPPGGPPETALPVYVRDKVALDVDEQRLRGRARTAAAIETARG